MLSWFKETSNPATTLILKLELDDKQIFTTLERITGKLIVKSTVDTSFDNLDIKLIGTSRTYGRRVVPQAPNARTVTTAHRFLELTQPELHIHYPKDRLFKAGCTYDFPFEFAIPNRMLPLTCRHDVASACIHDLHTSMPPSFGDHEFGGITDYAPRHASIKYRVVARIRVIADPGATEDITERSTRIQFMPSEAWRVPCVTELGRLRSLQRTTSIRKLWSRSSGRLVAYSIEPSLFQAKHVHSSIWRSELSGKVKIKLRFYPAYDESNPPEHIDLNAILRAKTVSAVKPLPQIPSESPWSGPEMDSHTAPAVLLSSQTNESLKWNKNSQDIAQSDEDCPAYDLSSSSPPPGGDSQPCYSACIELSLNTTMTFSLVPTFHSCLITRVYNLELRLGVRNLAFGFGPVLRLEVPVQVVLAQAVTEADSDVLEDAVQGQDLGIRMETHHLPPSYQSLLS